MFKSPYKVSLTPVRIALTALAIGCGVAPALALSTHAGSLTISDPWARATPKGAAVGGGYLTITNTGSEPDTLTGGSLIDADHVEIHEMKTEDGIMRMHPIAGGLVINPGQTVKLAPGGYHVMFMGMKAPLVKGQTVSGTLVFQKAGTVPVTFAIEGLGAMQAGGNHAAIR